MKKNPLYQIVIIVFSTFLASVSLLAQPRMTSVTRGIIKEVANVYKLSKGDSENWKNLLLVHPIYKRGNGYFLSFLAKKNTHFTESELRDLGIEIGSQIGSIVTLRIPVDVLSSVNSISGLEYLEVAGRVTPNLDRVVFDTRVDSVHSGINLPQSYTGQNVMIGISDWGFDYTSPMFYDTLLTQTRIHAAWDQHKTSGPAPAGYSYGAEFNGPAELLAAQSDTTNFYGNHTHGTHVAGIAGGSGAGIQYRGMAFEAEFLMVTLQLDQAAILDAFTWMKAKADAAGKRLVCNMSWGLYYTGPLDGNSLTSQAIDILSLEGVVFCNSAGNNGNVDFHIKKTFTSDTLKSRVVFYTYSYPGMWGESLSMWGEVGHSFQSKLVFIDGSNNILGETPMFDTNVDTNYIDTNLVVGLDTMWYKLDADDAHPLNGRPHMRLRIKNESNIRTILYSYADSGTVHYWNVTELINEAGNWGNPFLSLGAGYTAGDREYGVGEPAVTNSLITVGAHNAEYLNGLGNLVGGTTASFTSLGPTIDGRMKPDVSAPGGNVCSSISSFTDVAVTPITSVTFNSRVYPFARFSGTSMSSPATAGVVALILQANPLLTSQEVKDIIMITAREDSHTGDIPDSGSTRWGQGKVNAYYAIALALGVVGINDYADQGLLVYPNPSTDVIYIASDKNNATVYTLNMFSMDGQLINCFNYQWNTPIDISCLPTGVYFLRITDGVENYQCKFVKVGS